MHKMFNSLFCERLEKKGYYKRLKARKRCEDAAEGVIISEREKEKEAAETLAPPSGLCLEGGLGADLGNLRHEVEVDKADYCPPERGLVLGQRGIQEVSGLVCEWMNG